MPKPDLHLLVCTNQRPPEAGKPSCLPAGGLALYNALKDRVRDLGLKDTILVTRTGCLRHCSRGPVVAAWPGNRWHGRLAPEDAAELLDALQAGGGLERRAMPEGPWE